MGGWCLTATNWSFGWRRNWGLWLSQPGADGKGRAWEWVGERGGQPGRGPNASTMEESWVCAGGEEQIEIFTDSKDKSEEKNIEPWGTAVPLRSGSCPATRGSASLEGPRWRPPAGDGAAALVPLGAGAGVVGAVLPGRG